MRHFVSHKETKVVEHYTDQDAKLWAFLKHVFAFNKISQYLNVSPLHSS